MAVTLADGQARVKVGARWRLRGAPDRVKALAQPVQSKRSRHSGAAPLAQRPSPSTSQSKAARTRSATGPS